MAWAKALVTTSANLGSVAVYLMVMALLSREGLTSGFLAIILKTVFVILRDKNAF